ncbi:MAG: dihydrofolate reductase family protein [Bacteroidota bacterium]
MEALCQRAEAYYNREGIPFVTVTYAQSLDGSIAGLNGEPVAISCDESLVYTHALRACHDGIMVGIETVLSDNPSLSTRLVAGSSPRPIVLDSMLRMPHNAKLLAADNPVRPVIFTTDNSAPAQQEALRAKKACVKVLQANAQGWLALDDVLQALGEMGIKSLMVEGGGKVITSFIQSQAVDHLIVTLSMKMIGGRTVLNPQQMHNGLRGALPMELSLSEVHWEGNDIILHGDPVWEM